MESPILFYGLAFVTLLGALGVLLARHPVYAVLSLVAALFGLSGLFVLLGAFFVAAIQILVYAGAILVLFLFVVMLLDLRPDELSRLRSATWRGAALGLGGLLFWQTARVARTLPIPAGVQPVEGTVVAVGKLLFTTYALPFEAASLLLLVGVIGAVVLAKKKL
ncbi:MAG: NADH-quinone oxidoreductase subunit J [Candidatus Omnitrophica bacterium]|nr:NADH-quinone oxidoreductase subunit J [Candidatus Omnitrophota bacterium]